MKKLLIPFIAVLLLAQLQSETVLIYTRNNLSMNEEPAPVILQAQAAVEDGIMSVLFNDGHIVFNAGVVTKEEELDMVADRVSVRLAKNGGASWLVEVDLHYTVTSETKILENASYRLFDLSEDTQLIDETLSVQEVQTRDDQKIEELCVLLGEGIGFHVARWLPDTSLAKITN